jgi:Ran GTPase-activating protein (RanGAP) involved in mRNA processing and transport
VKELLIDRAGFETEQIAALLHSKYLTNVVRLDLIADDDNGHLDTEGLEVLGRTKALPSLRYLDLSYNCCGWMFSEHRNWIQRFTKGNLIGQLTTLRLRSTDVTDECARTLAKCKRADSLRHLDLSGNSIGEVGLRALATSPKLSSLATLDLRGNRYENEDGVDFQGCSPEVKRLLEDRFGPGLLLDGKPDPHPIDEWFKQFK